MSQALLSVRHGIRNEIAVEESSEFGFLAVAVLRSGCSLML